MVANATTTHNAPSERRLDEDGQDRASEFMPLAFKLAYRQYLACGGIVPHDELRGEALYALVYACSLFDESKGVPFRAYATMAITHYLINAVSRWRRRGGSLVHVRFSDLRSKEDPDTVCPWADEASDDAAKRDMIERVRWLLPKRLFEVLRLYYLEGLNMDQVGERLGVTRERVRQLIDCAFMRVRRRFPDFSWN